MKKLLKIIATVILVICAVIMSIGQYQFSVKNWNSFDLFTIGYGIFLGFAAYTIGFILIYIIWKL